jgi:hypothetical protein
MLRIPGRVVLLLNPLRLFPAFAVQVQVNLVESTLEAKAIFVLVLSQIVSTRGAIVSKGSGQTMTV